MRTTEQGTFARRTHLDRPQRPDSDLSGRALPHDVLAEQALLGACILEGGQDVLSRCIEAKLIGESFFKPAHQYIYEGLIDLYEAKIPIDEITLGDKLREKGYFDEIGGHAGLNELTEFIETTSHAPYYLQIVRDKYLLRRLIRSCMQTVERSYTQQESIERFLEDVEQSVFQISQDRISDAAQHVRSSVDQAVSIIYQLAEKKQNTFGILSGFTDLDRLTFGFHPQEMIVLAARPSVGKTSFAMNIAEAAVIPIGKGAKPIATLVFSLEMNADSLAMRMLCGHARVSMKRIRDGFLNDSQRKEIIQSAKKIKEAPLWIDDSGGLSILELRAKARRFKSKVNELGLIVIDYLQLLSGLDSRVNREQQIAEISRGIKAMAKELNVPVIVLSQLNRESEKEKRDPRLSDLRESGSIEQDADVVLMLNRPQARKDEEGGSASNSERIDLILAKQRNGPTGKITLSFNREYTRFENFARSPQSE